MNTTTKLFVSSLLFLFVGIFSANAQSIDVQNKVEYAAEQSSDDMNSISVPMKKMRSKKKRQEVSENDLKEVAEQTHSLRFRKKRNNGHKCFKKVVKKNSCKPKKIRVTRKKK